MAAAPASLPVEAAPWQARRLDRQGIADLRGWHRAAVDRAIRAGFDVIHVYAAHTYLPSQFPDPVLNASGGATLLERGRIVAVLIAEARETAGDSAATGDAKRAEPAGSRPVNRSAGALRGRA